MVITLSTVVALRTVENRLPAGTLIYLYINVVVITSVYKVLTIISLLREIVFQPTRSYTKIKHKTVLDLSDARNNVSINNTRVWRIKQQLASSQIQSVILIKQRNTLMQTKYYRSIIKLI